MSVCVGWILLDVGFSQYALRLFPGFHASNPCLDNLQDKPMDSHQYFYDLSMIIFFSFSNNESFNRIYEILIK